MSCREKSTYPGRGSARRYARKLTARYGGELYPYRCGECSRWHLTSAPPLLRTVDTRAVDALPRPGSTRRGRRAAPGQSVHDLAELMRAERGE